MQNNWIAVTERLPERRTWVLLLRGGMTAEQGYLDVGWRSAFGDDAVKDVTHWMPMPEPPKEV